MARDANRRTRVPKGNPRTVRSMRAARLSEEARAGLLGLKKPRGCRVGTRVPSHILGVKAREGKGVG